MTSFFSRMVAVPCYLPIAPFVVPAANDGWYSNNDYKISVSVNLHFYKT